MLGAILVFGGLGGAAFHPPAAALVYRLADHRKGLAMSAHLSGGSLGFALSPLVFVPTIARMGLEWSPLIMLPGVLALSWTLRQVPPMSKPEAHERSSFASLRPAAVPLALVYFTVVLRTRHFVRVHDVRADAADATRTVDRPGQRGRVPVSADERHRRLLRRPAVRSLRRAEGDGGHAGRVGAVPCAGAVALAVGLHGDARHRRPAAAVHAPGQRHLRPVVDQGRRGHRVVADDGVRVGHGQPGGAAHRPRRRSLGHQHGAAGPRGRPAARGMPRGLAPEHREYRSVRRRGPRRVVVRFPRAAVRNVLALSARPGCPDAGGQGPAHHERRGLAPEPDRSGHDRCGWGCHRGTCSPASRSGSR